MQKWILRMLVAASILPGCAAWAEMPDGEVYRDDDVAAHVLSAPALSQEIAYTPENAVAISSRAYRFLRHGDATRARQELDAALRLAREGNDYRQVLWSSGWALYDMKQVRDALRFWQTSVRQHGGRPHWAPYTYALAYWTLRDSRTALAWYTIAARSNPEWSNRKGFDLRTRAWTPKQRKEMLEVFKAWRKSDLSKGHLLRQ